MLVYEAVQLVYILVYDDVQPLLDCVVLGDLLRCECFRHCDRVRRGLQVLGLDAVMDEEVV